MTVLLPIAAVIVFYWKIATPDMSNFNTPFACLFALLGLMEGITLDFIIFTLVETVRRHE